jgi:hypothetical protein
MARISQRDAARGNNEETIGETPLPASTVDAQQLLFTVLKMLEPYVREANIELKSGERVTINKDWAIPTQFHCGEEKRPCANIERIEVHNGELFALCRKLKMSAFTESVLKVFLSQTKDLAELQSIKYGAAHRINELKIQNGDKRPQRPVKEQRKVGDYLYILQPGQKGGDYWYVQFNENGKRKQLYLGKERPSFDPIKDVTRKQKAMFASAHA